MSVRLQGQFKYRAAAIGDGVIRSRSAIRDSRQLSTTMTHPDKVYAITIAKNGGPEVVEKSQIPFPKVELGHILVKVMHSSPVIWATTNRRNKTEYFGINFIDTYFRQDRPLI